jgi:predicted RND superfamily exporter protein
MRTTYIAPWPVWCLFALVLIYLAVVGAFMNYLKRAHRQTWIELGSPSIILNNSIMNGLQTIRFIFGNRYKALNDRVLNQFVWTIRALFLAVLCTFLATAITH